MGARVVVVDDHRDVALAVDYALRALGHEVIIARDAKEALEAVIAHRPDLVLIDIVMPVVDGWELARSIRALELPRQPRLVAISGFTSGEDRERSMAAGFDEHVAKPIGMADLERLLPVN
jgi:CheY-like chemotaxis protein